MNDNSNTAMDVTPPPAPVNVLDKYKGREGYWTALIPGSKKQIIMREPTEAIIVNALDLIDPYIKRGNDKRAMIEAQWAQLRLSLVAVGNVEVSFQDIEGEGINKYLTMYERTFLVKALEFMTTPPDDDVEAFMSSLKRA